MFGKVSAIFVIGLLIGCNGAMAPPPEPGTPGQETPAGNGEEVTVTVQNIAFETDSISVDAGTEVVWVNQDSVAHTVTHGQQGEAVDDPVIDEPHPVGESVSFTFDQPGSYPITCTIHPQMNMTVNVD